jgi:hypothetical protein
MLVVAILPVITVAAAPFPVVAVGPVVAVVVGLFPGVVDAEAAANRICTTHIVEALLFWADPSPKTLLLIHKGYLLSHGPSAAPWCIQKIVTQWAQPPVSV